MNHLKCHLILSVSSPDHQKIWVKIKDIKYAHYCLGLNIHLEINFLYKKCQALTAGSAAWDPAAIWIHSLDWISQMLWLSLSVMLIINEGPLLLVWGRHTDSNLAFTPTMCFPQNSLLLGTY